MDRILRKVSKKHPAYFQLAKALQIEFFDFDEKAKEKVETVLKEVKDTTFEQEFAYNSDYILKESLGLYPLQRFLGRDWKAY